MIDSCKAPHMHLWKGVNLGVKRNEPLSKTLCLHFVFFNRVANFQDNSSSLMVPTNTFHNEDNDALMSQKRPSFACVTTSSQKKAKGTSTLELRRPPFWLGFKALNMTNQGKGYPKDEVKFVSQLVLDGMSKEEALECMDAVSSFPFVIQEEWPSKREGEDGQHFNITQIPLDVEVNVNGFAPDYHIAIFFELEEEMFSKEVVMELITNRLSHMKIELGDKIGEPIAPMFTHGGKKWSGIVKLHLKYPEVDGIHLLQGLRPFILKLGNGEYNRGKICKSYDSVALNNLLSVKIRSEVLINKEWYKMFEEVVEEGFLRGLDFEVTNIQKQVELNYAWIVASSPEQAKRIANAK